MGYTGQKPTAVPLTSADIAPGTIEASDLNSTLNLSSKTVTLPASSVTSHVTEYNDQNVRSDILKLALHQAIDGNRVAYSLEDSFVDGFEDDSGITTETTVDRDTTGEYVASVIDGGLDSNYVLVLQSDTTNNSTTFTDISANGHTMTAVGDAKHSTTKKKIGATSIKFDGSGDQVNASSSHADFAFGTGDFTIEGWINWTSAGTNKTFAVNRTSNATTAWYIGFNLSYELHIAHGSAVLLSSGVGFNAFVNQWKHVAVTRDSGTMRIYIDGVQQSSVANTTNFSSNNSIKFGGGDTQGASFFDGYMDALRVSKVCRYPNGTTFTPYTTNISSVVTNATGTLISDPQTASTSRTSASGVIIYSDAEGTSTLGSDLKIYFSCNNSAWTEASSYGTPQTYSGNKKLVKLGATTCSVSGTAIAMKAVWANQAAAVASSYVTGDRTSTITVTDDGVINDGDGVPAKLVDGVTNANSGSATTFFAIAVAGKYIRFQFSTSQVITEAKWYQSGTNTHGVWKWQGSNDASTWTDIGNSFTLGDTLQTQTELNGNTTSYTYYQLLGVSGNSSGSPWVREIEFKPAAVAGKEARLHGWAVNY